MSDIEFYFRSSVTLVILQQLNLFFLKCFPSILKFRRVVFGIVPGQEAPRNSLVYPSNLEWPCRSEAVTAPSW